MKKFKPKPGISIDKLEDNPKTKTTEEDNSRGYWKCEFEFVLASVGGVAGLGNIWKFPFLCQKHGASFFLTYSIILILMGLPMLLFELSIGQFTSNGALTSWNFSPILKSVGISFIVISSITGVYYQTITAWALWYFVDRLINIDKFPGLRCDNEWNTPSKEKFFE